MPGKKLLTDADEGSLYNGTELDFPTPSHNDKDHHALSPQHTHKQITGHLSPDDVEELMRELQDARGKCSIDILASFTDHGLKLLLQELLKNGHKVLELHKQQPCHDSEELDLITTCVKSSVEELWLSSDKNDNNLQIIEAIHQRDTPLEALHLRGHLVGHNYINSVTCSLSNINQLFLIACNIQSRCLKLLTGAISRLQKPLNLLCLASNPIGSLGIRCLCERGCISNIRQLLIPGCNVETAEVRILSLAIRQLHRPLHLLDISNNHIGSRGVEYVALCLHHADRLHMRDCLLQSHDVEVLSRSVKSRRNPLMEFDLSGNPVGSQGIRFLSRCVRNVVKLGLRGCSVLPFDLRSLLTHVDEKPCYLVEIDLRGNPIEPSDTERFCRDGIKIICFPNTRSLSRHWKDQKKEKERKRVQARQVSAVKRTISTTVGTEGGSVKIGGSIVSFPPTALSEETELELTAYYAPYNLSGKLSAVLTMKPGSLKFTSPIDVVLSICHITDGKQMVPIAIRQTVDGDHWKTIKTVCHSTQRQVCFQTNGFASVTIEPNSTIIHSHINKILVITAPSHYSNDQDEIVLSWFVFDDLKDAINVDKMAIIHKKRFVAKKPEEELFIEVWSSSLHMEQKKLRNEREFPDPWTATLKLRDVGSGIFYKEIGYRLHISSINYVEDFFFVPRDFRGRRVTAVESVEKETFKFVVDDSDPRQEDLRNGEHDDFM